MLIKDGKKLIQYSDSFLGNPPHLIDMYDCDNCGTSYPMINGKIMCNGHEIEDCPYCDGKTQYERNGFYHK